MDSENDLAEYVKSTKDDHTAVTDETPGDTTSDTGSEDSWAFEPPPLDLNYDALKHIGTYFLPGSHGACIDISTIPRGQFHEFRVLHFEDGWTCVGRFTRETEPLAKFESELATVEYVRKHTTIPVPEVYFVNFSENHAVGAAFVLMEHIKGELLQDLWDKETLSLDHKLDVVKQLAKVYGQLAGLKFETIGSLGTGGKVGPLLDLVEVERPLGEHPFTDPLDYMNAYMREDNLDRQESSRALYPTIKGKIAAHFAQNATNPTLHAPYRLCHGQNLEFDAVLVTQDDPSSPPKIRAIIDWDWSHTGLLYYLCEYPSYLHDWPDEGHRHADNKILRKQFVASIAACFPQGSADRVAVKQSFREKNHTMNFFAETFVNHEWEPEHEFWEIENYMNDIGTGEPAYYTEGWEPDSELESDDYEEE